LIAFPEGELYADDLNKTLKSMQVNKQYKELVIYLKVCATSNANPDLSSWATYCSPDEKAEKKNDMSSMTEYTISKPQKFSFLK
jgi:hypothetical protein